MIDNYNKNREYEFDALGRLIKAKGGTNELWTQNYSYDRYGNRTNVTATGVAVDSSPIPVDGTPNLSYEATTNRITTSGYLYDAAGNQTKAVAPNGTLLKFEYDAANRLQIVKRDSDGAYLQAFQYGSTNARLMDMDYSYGYLKIFAAIGGQTLAEYTEFVGAVPTWTKSYNYLGGSVLSTISNVNNSEVTEFNHPDRLGTRVTTNQAEGTNKEQTTLPFGTALTAESTTSLTKRFTSYERSNQTGLDYAINRTYDSKQGRFTQVDPIGMGAVSLSSPQTLNLYIYCGNDPINYTDPSGLFWGFFKKLFKWVMIAIAVVVAVMTIVAAPATLVGILGAISAGANAASQVLNAIGLKKAGMIFGIVAMVTGFGSIIAGKIGAGNTFASSDSGGDPSWFGVLSGVGAVVNSFTQTSEQRRRDDINKAVLQNALWRLRKKPGCANYIKGITSYDPATVLQTISDNGRVLYGGAGTTNPGGSINHGAIADAAGPQGSGATIFLNDQFYDKKGDVGGWKTRSTMNTLNARTMVLLHELRHAVVGYGHPNTGNPTIDEADPESNTNWNKNIAKECFGVTFK